MSTTDRKATARRIDRSDYLRNALTAKARLTNPTTNKTIGTANLAA